MVEDVKADLDNDKIDVGAIADGDDEEVAAAKPARGGILGIFSKMRGQLTKILGFSIAAILIILIAVGISYVVSTKVKDDPIKIRHGKIYLPPPPPPAYFDLKEFKMSTADKDETHFMRIKIVLGYKIGDMKLAAELGERRIQIEDIINTILSRKVKADFDTTEKKNDIKLEILNSINRILQNGRLIAIYFTEVAVM